MAISKQACDLSLLFWLAPNFFFFTIIQDCSRMIVKKNVPATNVLIIFIIIINNDIQLSVHIFPQTGCTKV